jgi:hypothetical protein
MANALGLVRRRASPRRNPPFRKSRGVVRASTGVGRFDPSSRTESKPRHRVRPRGRLRRSGGYHRGPYPTAEGTNHHRLLSPRFAPANSGSTQRRGHLLFVFRTWETERGHEGLRRFRAALFPERRRGAHQVRAGRAGDRLPQEGVHPGSVSAAGLSMDAGAATNPNAVSAREAGAGASPACAAGRRLGDNAPVSRGPGARRQPGSPARRIRVRFGGAAVAPTGISNARRRPDRPGAPADSLRRRAAPQGSASPSDTSDTSNPSP